MTDLISRAEVEAALDAEHRQATAEYTKRLNGADPFSAEPYGAEMNLCARLLCAIRALPAQAGDGPCDALCDSAYLAGLKRGWNCGIADDEEAYQATVRSRDGYLAPLARPTQKEG
jgi:hypothetical protein